MPCLQWVSRAGIAKLVEVQCHDMFLCYFALLIISQNDFSNFCELPMMVPFFFVWTHNIFLSRLVIYINDKFEEKTLTRITVANTFRL